MKRIIGQHMLNTDAALRWRHAELCKSAAKCRCGHKEIAAVGGLGRNDAVNADSNRLCFGVYVEFVDVVSGGVCKLEQLVIVVADSVLVNWVHPCGCFGVRGPPVKFFEGAGAEGPWPKHLVTTSSKDGYSR